MKPLIKQNRESFCLGWGGGANMDLITRILKILHIRLTLTNRSKPSLTTNSLNERTAYKISLLSHWNVVSEHYRREQKMLRMRHLSPKRKETFSPFYTLMIS